MIRKNANNYVFVPGLVIALLLQMTFIPQILGQIAIPNLVLIALIARSLLAGGNGALYAAFLAGYAIDIYSGKYFGTVMISFIVAIFFSSYLSHYFLKEAFSLQVLLSSILSVVLYHISYYSVAYILNSNQPVLETGSLAMAAAWDIMFLAILVYPAIFVFSYNRNEK